MLLYTHGLVWSTALCKPQRSPPLPQVLPNLQCHILSACPQEHGLQKMVPVRMC